MFNYEANYADNMNWKHREILRSDLCRNSRKKMTTANWNRISQNFQSSPSSRHYRSPNCPTPSCETPSFRGPNRTHDPNRQTADWLHIQPQHLRQCLQIKHNTGLKSDGKFFKTKHMKDKYQYMKLNKLSIKQNIYLLLFDLTVFPSGIFFPTQP